MGSTTTLVTLAGLISFFLLVGFMIPIINAEFNLEYDEIDTAIVTALDPSGVSVITIWDYLVSIVSLTIWSLAGIPAWLNLLLFIPRIMLGITIYVVAIHG